MPRNPKSISVAMAGHLAMGMVLGTAFALVLLLFSRDPPILHIILDALSPAVAVAFYIGLFAITFGLGATLTGLMMEAAEER
jgi:hypothetical protein